MDILKTIVPQNLSQNSKMLLVICSLLWLARLITSKSQYLNVCNGQQYVLEFCCTRSIWNSFAFALLLSHIFPILLNSFWAYIFILNLVVRQQWFLASEVKLNIVNGNILQDISCQIEKVGTTDTASEICCEIVSSLNRIIYYMSTSHKFSRKFQ